MNYNGGTTNGFIIQKETDENEMNFRLKLSKLFINKVPMSCSNFTIRNDRFLFNNIFNIKAPETKFNVTVPYNELTKIQYYIDNNLAMLAIKPINASVSKFMNWISTEKINNEKHVPDNFITLQSKFLHREMIERLRKVTCQKYRGLRIAEINYIYARKFIDENINDRTLKGNYENSQLIRKVRNNNELILIDDSDDDQVNSLASQEKPLHKVILRYSENQSNPIILYGIDLNCLRDGEYINDNIMNFYIQYCKNNCGLSIDELKRFHIFDALFATNLTEQKVQSRIKRAKSFEEKYHNTFKKWTKDIDIFSKDFLIIPVVKDFHWLLLIVCHVGNVLLNTDSNDFIAPSIIFMDSLNMGESVSAESKTTAEITSSIIDYIRLELLEKHGIPLDQDFLNGIFKIFYPKLPCQTNHYDCGLFVLEYFERFIKSADEVYQKILSYNFMLDWFDKKIVETQKRAKIQQIIFNQLPPNVAKNLEEELKIHNLNAFQTTENILST